MYVFHQVDAGLVAAGGMNHVINEVKEDKSLALQCNLGMFDQTAV